MYFLSNSRRVARGKRPGDAPCAAGRDRMTCGCTAQVHRRLLRDRESPQTAPLTDTWQAWLAGTVSLMSGALAVGICGVVLASLSLGWQAAIYVLSGGRVKVRLLVGALGNGGMATKPAADLSAGWLK
jgi:hypothetical protein